MKYSIEGGSFPVVKVEMTRGERLFTESGGMAWMSDDFKMDTNTRGGLGKALIRSLGGQSLFLTTYECENDSGEIVFATNVPGEIKAVQLKEGQTLVCQKHTFLAGEEGLDIDIVFTKKFATGLFGGKGFILQKVTGPGLCFLEFDGAIMEYTLAPGEVLKCDQDHIAMFEESVDFDLTQVKGAKNVFFSGEGLFFSTLTGPGRVWLQTMPLTKMMESYQSVSVDGN